MDTRHIPHWALGLVACLLLASCSVVPRIPAKGEFLGEVFATTVDSEIARYYLEEYLPGKPGTGELRSRIDAVHRQYATALPSRDELAAIAEAFSVDFASLFLAERLLSSECNGELNRAFLRYVSDENATAPDASQYVLLFVPGWDYVQNGHLTGADFAQPRRLANQLGIENHLVALPPTGGVEENAAVLAVQVRRHIRPGRKILVAGASSAGPAIHLTLAELLGKEELRSIKAWLNLGGILQGSPLIDHYQELPQAWLFDAVARIKGWSKDAIRSMATGSSRERYRRLKIDGDVFIANYLGVPLSGQLSRYSRDKYPLLREQGPNDGLTLLTDAMAPDGLTIVALGSDHFFAEDPRIAEKTIALMKLVITYLERPGAQRMAGRCAIQPRRVLNAPPARPRVR